MRLYFARHGESEANVLQVISNRGLQHPLTPRGRAQAAALAAHLQACGIGGIYSSPLLRGAQTAEILSERLGVGFQITDALREYDCGVLEGTTGAETWAAFWALRDDWRRGRWERRIEGGESFLDIQARFTPFVQALIANAAARDENMVLIGHGGLYTSMLPLVLVNIDAGFPDHRPFPNTGYVLAENRPEGLVCLEWCGARVAF